MTPHLSALPEVGLNLGLALVEVSTALEGRRPPGGVAVVRLKVSIR
jgi:hypothetical protein